MTFDPSQDITDINVSLGKITASATANIVSRDQQIAIRDQQIVTLNQHIAELSAPLPEGYQDMQMHADWTLNIGPGGWIDPNANFPIKVSPGIGPIDPAARYTMKRFQNVAGEPYAMVITLQSPQGSGSDILFSVRRDLPAQANIIKFGGKFRLTPGAGQQALETDTRTTDNNKNGYNTSGQINFPKGGMVQVSKNVAGKDTWMDTGIVLGVPTPNVWHSYLWEYALDYTAKTFSHVAYTYDGKRYLIPAVLQNQPAVPNNWTPGVYCQLQVDTNGAGIGVNNAYSGLNYEFG